MQHLHLAQRALIEAKQLLELPDVKRVVDTASADDGSFGHAARVDGSRVIAWHITDDPEGIVRSIKKRTDFKQGYGEKGRGAELGPGLYVTAALQYWAGRARNKWAFMKTISPADLQRLLDALDAEVESDRKRQRMSDREYERAKRDLGYVRDGQASPELLIGTLANQPYMIPFASADWLEEAGLEHLAPKPTRAVEVQLLGKYAELASAHVDHGQLRLMRRAGLSGIFVKSSHELCVWSGKDVRALDIIELT